MCMYLKYESTISKIAKNFQRVFCYQNTKICTSRKKTQQNIKCVHGLWIHEIGQHNTTPSWRQKVVIQNTNQHIERGFPTNQINNLTSFVTLTYHEYHWGGQGHGKNTKVRLFGNLCSEHEELTLLWQCEHLVLENKDVLDNRVSGADMK